jgi:hypothetical protein
MKFGKFWPPIEIRRFCGYKKVGGACQHPCRQAFLFILFQRSALFGYFRGVKE